jgi:hypothetical protein
MEASWAQALTWRLGRHYLLAPHGSDAVEIVRRLCGVQAQVPSAAQLAVAVRCVKPAQDTPAGQDVGVALAQHRLVRTWAMRGTLHLLPTDTLADQLALLAAARTWEKGSWQRTFADAATMSQLADLVSTALDGPPLTREELVSAVAGQAHNAALAEQLRSAWSALLKPLSWQGLLCQGPAQGGKVTLTRPDRWVPGWPGLPDPDAAAAAVVRAYLGADELAVTRATAAVHLLPAFDQYVLGPGTADAAVVPTEHRARVSRAAGWIAPVLVVGGRVAGTWEPADGGIRVDAFPETHATAHEADPGLLAAEIQRVGLLAGR